MAPASIVSNGNVTPTVTTRFASVYSEVQNSRVDHKLRLPSVLQTPFAIVDGPKSSAAGNPDEIAKLFPFLFGQPSASLVPADSSESLPHRKLKIGVVLSGGQAPGGHNVISGIYDYLQQRASGSTLYGFKGGPAGIMKGKYVELNSDYIYPYRNQGGFDMICSGRDKIETPDQFKQAEETVKKLDLDGLVVIGGDDSNTNACLLAENFRSKNLKTQVLGCPKTIDGDLKSKEVPTSFGFDTACKIYAEMIGNVMIDARSTGKYYHFVRLMGRAASHITLECALQTHPNITIIGEEVAAKKLTLKNVTDYIVDVISKRAEDNYNYGVILIPEGLIDFIPEVQHLIAELNEILAHDTVDEGGLWKKKLNDQSLELFEFLPQAIQEQLLLERDPHGNVQVAKIETEKMLIEMVETELGKRKQEGKYKGEFKGQSHFFGYEGRCGLPTNFDANYCYALGYGAGALLHSGKTGLISSVANLCAPVEEWTVGGTALTSLMDVERRHGKFKPVIKKAIREKDNKSSRIKPAIFESPRPDASKPPPAHELDSLIKLPHLLSTLIAASHTKNKQINNYNVVFAAASLKSAAALIPQACEMARWQRNDVHFMIMGRDGITMNTLKSFNGIGENCKVKFHDARPDFSISSSNSRMKSCVSFAFKEVHKYLKPEAILVDASKKEDEWFREWIKLKALDLGTTIIELPENAEEKLKWIPLLDAKSLSAWNRVSVEIIIHSQPSATGSLIRLLESLKKADYFSSRPPHLTIELPHNIEEQTSQYLSNFKWPPFDNPSQGNLLTLHHRIPQYGLTPEDNSIRMLESFWPSDPFSSQVLVLSTQAEVSPLYYHYLKYLILEYRYSSEGPEKQGKLLGISLDLPSSFLNDTTSFEPPKINQRKFMPFLWQAPNSNACLFFADKWTELHDFVSRSLNSQHTLPLSKNLATSVKYVSKTFPSWLEYILQLARLRGYMTLYPNFGINFSLLTVHNELYRVPEEYKSDLESQSSSPSNSNGGSEKYLSPHRKENPLIVDSLFSTLFVKEKLPILSELSMISWDGEESDDAKLDTLATNYQNLFRREKGGCTEEASKKRAEFSAGDLFCLKDEKYLTQPPSKD